MLYDLLHIDTFEAGASANPTLLSAIRGCFSAAKSDSMPEHSHELPLQAEDICHTQKQRRQLTATIPTNSAVLKLICHSKEVLCGMSG
jgi:hypothetical protein